MHQALGQLLSGETDIEFAVLVGSRTTGTTHSGSDWDIALQWDARLDWIEVLGKTETLRRKMAEAISVASDKIDLIELRRANLAMRAEKVTELVVSGSDKFITEFLLKAVAEK